MFSRDGRVGSFAVGRDGLSEPFFDVLSLHVGWAGGFVVAEAGYGCFDFVFGRNVIIDGEWCYVCWNRVSGWAIGFSLLKGVEVSGHCLKVLA